MADFLTGFFRAWRPFSAAFMLLYRTALTSFILFLSGAALLSVTTIASEVCFISGAVVLLIGGVKSWCVVLRARFTIN